MEIKMSERRIRNESFYKELHSNKNLRKIQKLNSSDLELQNQIDLQDLN